VSKDPYYAMVREFHEAFSLPVRDKADVGTPEERVLRVRLLLEEVLEFAKAAGVEFTTHYPGGGRIAISRIGHVDAEVIAEPNLSAMAHELADVAYVVHGTAVQLGIPLLPVTGEIHSANIRKRGPDGRPIIDMAGKILKPAGWTPADVEGVLAGRLTKAQAEREVHASRQARFMRARELGITVDEGEE
jgi:predicted HAD superfamily Cof-like phosphohydrolase